MTLRPRHDDGFSLVQAVAVVAVMMVMMAVGMPSWRYVMQDAREEELIFRGCQIAEAVARYQGKHGNALPTSLDVLVKGKFLRKAYKDPMTRGGEWRYVRAGEIQPAGGTPSPAPSGAPSPSPSTGTRSGGSTTGGGSVGGFMGVASTGTATSIRIVNGKTKHNEWLFVAGQQRTIGNNTPLSWMNGCAEVRAITQGQGDGSQGQTPDTQ